MSVLIVRVTLPGRQGLSTPAINTAADQDRAQTCKEHQSKLKPKFIVGINIIQLVAGKRNILIGQERCLFDLVWES